MSQAEEAVIDVSDATFEAEVLEASRTKPVVVDFWAPWCGPCRTLGPLLERLAAQSGGAFRLAKIDIDRNPLVAQSFHIQSIPFVVAVRDGQIVSEFVGAQPEAEVRRFLERILPDEADEMASLGERLAAAGKSGEAESRFRDALSHRPDHPRAALGLARILAASDRAAEAATLLSRTTAEGEIRAEIEKLAAQLRVGAGGDVDEASLRAAIEAQPGDLDSRLALGRLLAATARHEEALEVFLDLVRRDREFQDAAARKAMLDLFTFLGRENPLVDRYQRQLSQVLFS